MGMAKIVVPVTRLTVCGMSAIYSGLLKAPTSSVAKRALLYVRQEAAWFLPRMADQQPNGVLHYRFWQQGGGYDRNIYEPGGV